MASGKSSKGSRGKKRPPAKRPPGPASAPGGTGGARPGGLAAGTPGPAGATGTEQAGAKAKVTRAERLEAARRARKRKAALTRAGVAGAVAVLVLVVAVVVVSNKKDAKADQQRLTAGSCTYDTKSDPTGSTVVNRHVPPASYAVDPPAGGNHDPSAAPAGLYDGAGQSPPKDPQLVHSLEHGFVVIWHRPGLSEADLAAVHGVFDDHPDDVLVVPRASLKGKVAATSWGRRLLCGEVEPDVLSEFVDLYRNKSPEPGVR